MFTSKKIKLMSKEINQLKLKVVELDTFKDNMKNKEWSDSNPKGVLAQTTFTSINGYRYAQIIYKNHRNADGITLKTMRNGLNGYKIIGYNRIEVDGIKIELIAQYGTWIERNDYITSAYKCDEIFYESKFLIDLQSNSGIEMSCKEITVVEFNKEIIK